MTFEDWLDALVFTWAIVVGFAMGATLALQFGNLLKSYWRGF